MISNGRGQHIRGGCETGEDVASFSAPAAWYACIYLPAEIRLFCPSLDIPVLQHALQPQSIVVSYLPVYVNWARTCRGGASGLFNGWGEGASGGWRGVDYILQHGGGDSGLERDYCTAVGIGLARVKVEGGGERGQSRTSEKGVYCLLGSGLHVTAPQVNYTYVLYTIQQSIHTASIGTKQGIYSIEKGFSYQRANVYHLLEGRYVRFQDVNINN